MQTLNMEQNYRRYSSSKLAVEIHMHAYLTYFNHPLDYLSPFNFFSSTSPMARDWRDCKYWLLSLFKLMVEGIREKQAAGKGQDTLVEQLMKSVDEPSAHNYALLLLWASQANAVPVSVERS